MGALVPTITGLTTAISAVDTLTNTVKGFGGRQEQPAADNSAAILRAQQTLALQQLQEQQAAQGRDLAERTAIERQKIQTEAGAAEQQRIASLRRAVARQRAAFGASGIEDSGDGSAEAVLLGLFEETDNDRQERERLDDIRNRVLDQEAAAQTRRNVLQMSQLKQKQQLQRIAEEF